MTVVVPVGSRRSRNDRDPKTSCSDEDRQGTQTTEKVGKPDDNYSAHGEEGQRCKIK